MLCWKTVCPSNIWRLNAEEHDKELNVRTRAANAPDPNLIKCQWAVLEQVQSTDGPHLQPSGPKGSTNTTGHPQKSCLHAGSEPSPVIGGSCIDWNLSQVVQQILWLGCWRPFRHHEPSALDPCLGGWAVLKHHQRGCHKPSFPSRTLDWFKKIIAIHNSVVSMLCADCSMSYVHLVFNLCKLFWSLLERSTFHCTFFLHKCQFMCGKMLKHCFWVYTVFIHLAQGPKFPIIQHKNHTFIPYSL